MSGGGLNRVLEHRAGVTSHRDSQRPVVAALKKKKVGDGNGALRRRGSAFLLAEEPRRPSVSVRTSVGEVACLVVHAQGGGVEVDEWWR